MKKLFISIVLLFLSFSAVLADEVKTYYAEKGNYYTLFCSDNISGINLQASGHISYSVNSDITNSKSYITFFIQSYGEVRVELSTEKETKVYRIISNTKDKETCDETFYRIDTTEDKK